MSTHFWAHMFTIWEQILFAAKFRYHILEGRAITLGQGTHCELVNWLCRCRFGLQHGHATKSRAWNYGDFQDGPVHSSGKCDHLFFLWCGDRLIEFGQSRRKIRIWTGYNVHSKKVNGRNKYVKKNWRDAFFLWELKADIFKLHDLRTSEVGTKYKPKIVAYILSYD